MISASHLHMAIERIIVLTRERKYRQARHGSFSPSKPVLEATVAPA
jgi:hypothetical protein